MYEENNVLPKVAACFGKLFLPTVHVNKEEFFKYFMKALAFGAGFGI